MLSGKPTAFVRPKESEALAIEPKQSVPEALAE